MRKPLRTTSGWQIWLLVLLMPLLVAALTYANYQFSLQAPGGNDFLPRYLGARAFILEGTSPYAPEVSEEAQRSIYGRLADPEAGEDVAHFAYPLPVVLFVGPFSLLPYPLARSLWMTLLQMCLPLLFICGIRISSWRPGPLVTAILLIISVLWYFGFRAMILGQFAVIEALLVAIGLLLVRRGLDVPAGIAFGLSIAKPQVVVLLIPLVLLWGASRRRWALVVATVASILVQAVGFMAVLPNWPIQWIYQLLEYPTYTYPGSPISIMFSWLPIGQSVATTSLSLLLLFYLAWTWYKAWGGSEPLFQWTAGITLVITQLIAPRTATTNFLVFVPSLMLVLGIVKERWPQRSGLAISLTLGSLVIVPWVLFLTTVSGDRESPIMHLPFPLFMLLALWWTRWWLTQRSSIPTRA